MARRGSEASEESDDASEESDALDDASEGVSDDASEASDASSASDASDRVSDGAATSGNAPRDPASCLLRQGGDGALPKPPTSVKIGDTPQPLKQGAETRAPVRSRPPSPKPPSVVETESELETSDGERTMDEDDLRAKPLAEAVHDDRSVHTDPCAAWANESAVDDETGPHATYGAAPPHVAAPRRRRSIFARRGAVLQSLAIAEPSTQLSRSYTAQLDTTHELVLAAELLLLHKPADADAAARPTDISALAQLSEEETDDEASSPPRRGPVPIATPTLRSPLAQSAASSPGLSFRREREMQQGRYPPYHQVRPDGVAAYVSPPNAESGGLSGVTSPRRILSPKQSFYARRGSSTHGSPHPRS